MSSKSSVCSCLEWVERFSYNFTNVLLLLALNTSDLSELFEYSRFNARTRIRISLSLETFYVVCVCVSILCKQYVLVLLVVFTVLLFCHKIFRQTADKIIKVIILLVCCCCDNFLFQLSVLWTKRRCVRLKTLNTYVTRLWLHYFTMRSRLLRPFAFGRFGCVFKLRRTAETFMCRAVSLCRLAVGWALWLP